MLYSLLSTIFPSLEVVTCLPAIPTCGKNERLWKSHYEVKLGVKSMTRYYNLESYRKQKLVLKHVPDNSRRLLLI